MTIGDNVNEAVTVSAPGFPVSVIVYGLPATVAMEFTANVPVAVPPLIEHFGLLISMAPLFGSVVDVKVQAESVNCNPLPTNEIVWPGEPNDGVNTKDVVTVIVKVPTAVSPKLPVTNTV